MLQSEESFVVYCKKKYSINQGQTEPDIEIKTQIFIILNKKYLFQQSLKLAGWRGVVETY